MIVQHHQLILYSTSPGGGRPWCPPAASARPPRGAPARAPSSPARCPGSGPIRDEGCGHVTLSPPIRAHLGRDQGEAEEEDVSAGVGEGPQPGVLLLARRVPQVQRHLLPQHRHLDQGSVRSNISTSAVKRSIDFAFGFHNHGEGPY